MKLSQCENVDESTKVDVGCIIELYLEKNYKCINTKYEYILKLNTITNDEHQPT